MCCVCVLLCCFFCQAEDGIRDLVRSRGLGDVYKRQELAEFLPDHVDDNAGVVLEPLAVALHAIRLVKPRDGSNIVILGTGVLGSCVLMPVSYTHLTLPTSDLV